MTTCPVCLKNLEDSVLVCPDCGFKFSSKTTSFKPIGSRDIEQKKVNIDTNNNHNVPILRIIKGPYAELEIPLNKNKITIGRSPKSDIFLNDRTVSRQHAIITKEDDNVRIIDCDSFNGLWINKKHQLVYDLNNGDIIQIGIFLIQFFN